KGSLSIGGRLALRRQLFTAHDGGQALGHDDLGCPGLPDAGAVLRRDPAAVVNRLPLAEQVGLLLTGGQGRREPLEGSSARGRGVLDDDALGAVQLDRERGSKLLVLNSQLPRQRTPGA